VDILEDAFTARSRGEIVNRPRVRVPITGGNYNLMPAGWVAKGVVGHKTYTASPKGVSFQIVIFAADGSGLLAVMGGRRISALRTGAVTGIAVRHLASVPGEPIALIGTGLQATAQVHGLLAATGTRETRVYSRRQAEREAFAANMSDVTGVSIEAVGSSAEALDGVSVVVTITNSAEPVLQASDVRAGSTVVAAGNNTWLRSEIEPAIAALADLVVVDDVEDAKIESGELMRAAELGLFSWDRAVALHDVIGGVHPGRTDTGQIILCELQGIGIEDVAVAQEVYRRAREQGVGMELPE
jgi:ornithine cyclodeaminase/alanine dehydrogenase-like protein (mu-crystallin family)